MPAEPKGMTFQCENGDFNGAGLFAALSFDDGKTWPHKRLVTPGGKTRTVNGIDRNQFTLSDTRAEHNGYLAAIADPRRPHPAHQQQEPLRLQSRVAEDAAGGAVASIGNRSLPGHFSINK